MLKTANVSNQLISILVINIYRNDKKEEKSQESLNIKSNQPLNYNLILKILNYFNYHNTETSFTNNLMKIKNKYIHCILMKIKNKQTGKKIFFKTKNNEYTVDISTLKHSLYNNPFSNKETVLSMYVLNEDLIMYCNKSYLNNNGKEEIIIYRIKNTVSNRIFTLNTLDIDFYDYTNSEIEIKIHSVCDQSYKYKNESLTCNSIKIFNNLDDDEYNYLKSHKQCNINIHSASKIQLISNNNSNELDGKILLVINADSTISFWLIKSGVKSRFYDVNKSDDNKNNEKLNIEYNNSDSNTYLISNIKYINNNKDDDKDTHSICHTSNHKKHNSLNTMQNSNRNYDIKLIKICSPFNPINYYTYIQCSSFQTEYNFFRVYNNRLIMIEKNYSYFNINCLDIINEGKNDVYIESEIPYSNAPMYIFYNSLLSTVIDNSVYNLELLYRNSENNFIDNFGFINMAISRNFENKLYKQNNDMKLSSLYSNNSNRNNYNDFKCSSSDKSITNGKYDDNILLNSLNYFNKVFIKNVYLLIRNNLKDNNSFNIAKIKLLFSHNDLVNYSYQVDSISSTFYNNKEKVEWRLNLPYKLFLNENEEFVYFINNRNQIFMFDTDLIYNRIIGFNSEIEMIYNSSSVYLNHSHSDVFVLRRLVFEKGSLDFNNVLIVDVNYYFKTMIKNYLDISGIEDKITIVFEDNIEEAYLFNNN